MNKKDAEILKILSELGLRKEPDLSDEQEKLLQRALNPEEDFLISAKNFLDKQNNSRN